MKPKKILVCGSGGNIAEMSEKLERIRKEFPDHEIITEYEASISGLTIPLKFGVRDKLKTYLS